MIRDTSIPVEAAWGTFEAPHKMKRTRHTESPIVDAVIAPILPSLFENSPHMNGPRNTEAIAPHDIDNMVTITAGFCQARIIDRIMKNPLLSLPSFVRVLSEAFLFMKP